MGKPKKRFRWPLRSKIEVALRRSKRFLARLKKVREISYDSAYFHGRGFDARYSTDTGVELRLRSYLADAELDALESVDVDRYAKIWGLVHFGRLFAPHLPLRIRVRALSLDPADEERFRTWCIGILGEALYINRLPAELDLTFSGERLAPRQGAANLGERAVLMSGGGKDSAVMGEVLKALDVPFRWFCIREGSEAPTRELAKIAGSAPPASSAWCNEIRGESGFEEFNPAHLRWIHRRQKKRDRGRRWLSLMSHVVEGCFQAELSGSRYVVVGNERSANEGNGIYIGDLEVNHQYSKSYAFEEEFAVFLAKYLHPELSYASLLMPLSELQIAKIFTSYPQYFPVFRSCNLRLGTTKWCLDCPKCAFVFLMLSAFVDGAQVSEVFGADLLSDSGHVQTFLDLCGLGRHKPLECVGEAGECLLALYLASQRRTAAPLHPRLAAALPSDEEARALQDRILGEFNDDNGLPPQWDAKLRQMV